MAEVRHCSPSLVKLKGPVKRCDDCFIHYGAMRNKLKDRPVIFEPDTLQNKED
jgi:hypothetical protein